MSKAPVCPECGSSALTCQTVSRWHQALGNWDYEDVIVKSARCIGCDADEFEPEWVDLDAVPEIDSAHRDRASDRQSKVRFIVNDQPADRSQFPKSVVYEDADGNLWTLPLAGWNRQFSIVK